MSAPAPISACPACAAVPLVTTAAQQDTACCNLILSVPGMHCAACMSTVERVLKAQPDVRDARVNLGRKQVAIKTPGNAEPARFVSALQQAGFEAFELDTSALTGSDFDRSGRDLLTRLSVAGFAMMNVMLLSVAVWSGAADATRAMFHWISAAIAVPALIYAAQVFFCSAWSALRVGRLNMDVPISVAIILAAAMSVFETSRGAEHVYFDAALSLTFFLLLGRYLDHRARRAARSAAQELTALDIPRVTRITPISHETVHASELRVGDHIALKPGMRLPVDGVLTDGRSRIDRSFLTGESLSVRAELGMALAAGEINLSAPITVRVTAIGENTTLRRIAALVEMAEGARNRYTALADRAARIYAPLVHLLAFAAFTGWIWVSGDVIRSLNVAISVLIITCPCALGLAVPAVMTVASGRLFRSGILIKNGTALERLAEVDTVVFDKTGTLTEGQMDVDLSALSKTGIGVLKALAQCSDHPIAKAIEAAIPPGSDAARLGSVTEHPGLGIEASFNGTTARLGRSGWVGGKSSPAFRIGTGQAHDLHVRETLQSGACAALSALKKTGYDVHILTGDTQSAARDIADRLNIPQIHSEMMPDNKLRLISQLQADGHRTMMIGDGLNDTVALAAAHASLSPASALDASRAASDVVLLNKDLSAIPGLLATSKNVRSRVIENFSIAAAYNLIAIPLALAGLATPLAAAIAMSLSSITVLTNALRAR